MNVGVTFNISRGGAILPHSPCTNTLREHHGVVDVLGEDGSTQAVRSGIGSFYHLVQCFKLQNLLHWSKDLQKGDNMYTIET